MNVNDPVIPSAVTVSPGIDLRTWMATQFMAAIMVQTSFDTDDEQFDEWLDDAIFTAEKLIDKLNVAKQPSKG